MNNRKIVIPLVLILALGAASTASAGGSIFAGANFPTGGFSDGAKTGWNLGGYYTFDLMPIVDIGGLLAYSDFSTDLGDFPELDEALDGSINVWELHALGQLNFLMLKGFLGLGIGSYKDVNDLFETERKTDFSWQIGLSMNIAVLEARLGYHQIPVEESSINWMSLTVGLTF